MDIWYYEATAESLDWSVLSRNERERAARYKSPAAMRRFVAGRSLLRRTLGHYLSRDPRAIVFRCGAAGKPSLAGSEISFNASHSGNAGIIAIGWGTALGVDLETIDPDIDWRRLAARLFRSDAGMNSAREVYQRWTDYEAYSKARGQSPNIMVDVPEQFWQVHPIRGLPAQYAGSISMESDFSYVLRRMG